MKDKFLIWLGSKIVEVGIGLRNCSSDYTFRYTQVYELMVETENPYVRRALQIALNSKFGK